MGVLIRGLSILLFITGYLSAFSQVIDASICDSTNRFPITKYSHFLRTTEPITIDSALQSSARFIKSPNKPVLVFEYDPYYYWFRIIVKNQQERDRQLMLLMAPVGMYEGRLYQKNEGKWEPVAQSGLKFKFEERSYQFTHHVFPFTLPAKISDTLYVSINASNVYKAFGLALIKPKDLKIFENKIYFVFGIIVGLLLLFFILNIASFFALKEKLHLWYALYIALLFLVVMKNDHLDQQFLGLDSEKAFRRTPYGTIGAVAIAVLLHVVQNFFKAILLQNKLLYRLSTILKVNVISIGLAHAFVFAMVHDYRVQSVVFSWMKLSILFCICIIIVNCIYCIKKGFKSAWFILTGSLVFMIGSLQRLFFPSTLSFLFPPTTFHIGIILETIVISIGLIYRYWYREQQIQIQVMNDISGELHDNVTPSLTTAALYLKSRNDAQFGNKVNDAINLIGKANDELRDFSRTLRDDSPPRTDLVEQIKTECLSIANTGIFKIDFTTSGHSIELEKKKQAMIIRIVKEVLQNAIKHSNASNVIVAIVFTERLMSLKIQDNGIGFDVSLANPNSNGLKNIKNRSFLLNATCHIESQKGRGTEVFISMPL